MGITVDLSDALKKMDEIDRKLQAAVGVYADTAGKKMEAEAKKNKPWEDDTGIAKQTIKGGHEWENDVCYIYLTGNTNYFPYLELANEKRFAILYPTIQKNAPGIMSGFKKLLGR